MAHGVRVALDGCLFKPVDFHVVVRLASEIELGLDVSVFGVAFGDGAVQNPSSGH